jgi:hypothetical protein
MAFSSLFFLFEVQQLRESKLLKVVRIAYEFQLVSSWQAIIELKGPSENNVLFGT